MPASPGTVERVALILGQAFAPLEQRLAAGQVLDLFTELGVQFPPTLTGQVAFANALQTAGTSASQLPPLVHQLATAIDAEDVTQIAAAVAPLIAAVTTLAQALDAVATQLPAAATAVGFSAADAAAFAGQLVDKLTGYILVRYLEGNAPVTLGLLNMAGLVDRGPVAAGGPTQPGHVQRSLRLDRLSGFFSNPLGELSSIYGWSASGFDGHELLRRLAELFTDLALPAHFDETAAPPVLELFALSVRPKLDISPPGLRVDLRGDVPGMGTITVPLSPGLSLELVVAGDISGGTSLVITPPSDFAFTPPSGTLQGSVLVRIVRSGSGATPLVLFGTTGGSGLRAHSIKLGLGASLQWETSTNSALGEFLVEMSLTGGEIAVDLGGADSFVGSLLGSGGVHFPFDATVGWSAHRGVYFSGGASLEVNLPLHVHLGPVELDAVHLTFGVHAGDLTLDTTLTAAGALGPLSVSVDRIGFTSDLKLQRGNLGPVDLGFRFHPPSGLGLNLDAGIAAGGGYIFFDPDKGEYAGVLDVAIAEIIQVKVIGVLDTRMPDGSPGFSFLLIITFDLPPIQLGFGFTLNGVGGLAGINRTMSVDALHAGLRAHSLNSILFPPDPVRNAPRIISDIRSFFPIAVGRYIFGPMFELGWGTPTLIKLAVGILLDLPDPVRLAILGLIDAGLPSEDVALIELHIDILGIIDFEAKTISIDGSLYDSRVLIYSLAGDLAFRLSWGANPNFVFSLGGFNPHFNTAGLDVPTMHRLSVSIGDGDNPRLSANSYFAVTSNSVQFGANVEAYAAAGGFSIHGWIGYDVLIIISPFSFEFDFSAGFDVSFEGHSLAGLTVNGVFSGPHPWHLHGDATLHILFFSVSASLTLTWGDPTPVVLPQKAVLPDLLAAFQNPLNWQAILPAGASQAVTFAAPSPGSHVLRVHPMGSLSVRENVVPLDLPITRYGSATPSDGDLFAIASVTVNVQVETTHSFSDYFASGQFLALSDADKLSRPSFEKYDAGVTIGSDTVVTGADSPRTVIYEERYIDTPLGFSRRSRLYAMPLDVHLALTRQGAGFMSPLKTTGFAKYQAGPAAPPIATQDVGYVIASTDDLSVRSDLAASQGGSYYQTQAVLNAHLALHPEDAASLQIMPAHEAVA